MRVKISHERERLSLLSVETQTDETKERRREGRRRVHEKTTSFEHTGKADELMRYALYFTPSPASPWHAAGSSWLGRDAVSGAVLAQPAIPGVPAELFAQLTQDARRYGFHATLKAPFRLAKGASPERLLDMVTAFCASQQSIVLRAPHVARHRDSLALLVDDAGGAVTTLAGHCVSHVDRLRAPLTPTEIARRRRDNLNQRQEALLQRWGYPYTEEYFRFHMTLSGALSEHSPDVAARVQQAAQQHFAAVLDAPLVIDGLSIMREPEPGAPFMLWQHRSFAHAAPERPGARCDLHCI
jgi:ribose 1,5-bisphosphokinase